MAMMTPGGGRRKGRQPPMSEINVTPLVDVMLVLLIIFMVTAPLLVAGVPVDLPQSRAGALDKERKPISISLDEKGRVFIDEDEVGEASLADKLAQIAARPGEETGGPRIFLRAFKGLDYGRVMQVMGEIDHAGLKRVALVTTESPSKP
jgi:biopolymer transport protein TolR